MIDLDAVMWVVPLIIICLSYMAGVFMSTGYVVSRVDTKGKILDIILSIIFTALALAFAIFLISTM